MSEIINSRPGNPEKERQPKPMYDNCDRCKTKYELTPKNTAGYDYEKQPECNWLYCICPNCEYRTQIFIGKETTDNARLAGVTMILDQYADDNTYDLWCQVRGIELPKTHEITDRQEKIVAGFGQVIANMPPELFWQGIEDATERPYPPRWV